MRIHHVQLMIPRGHDAQALAFYRDILGLAAIERPADMPNPEGFWFRVGDLELHLGVQDDLPIDTRAHIAFVVSGFDALVARLEGSGARLRASNVVNGQRRVHVWDPFGNRLELIGG